MTRGDVAAWPRTVSQQVAGNLVAGAGAGVRGRRAKASRFGDHPSWAPTEKGGKMPDGMLSQAGAGRKGFLSGEPGTH